MIDTAGVNINGENLVFQLTLNDAVKFTLRHYFTLPVAAYAFNAFDRIFPSCTFDFFVVPSQSQERARLRWHSRDPLIANNDSVLVETVWFENTTAAFLEGATFTVLNTGYRVGFLGSIWRSFALVNQLPDCEQLATELRSSSRHWRGVLSASDLEA